jgi:hypothetical protein
MTLAPEYLGPYIGSNVVAIGLLLVAVFWPKVARVLFIVIFIAAGLFNAYMALTQPEGYLNFGELAVLPIYRDFIYGVFSRYTRAFILAIAAGQLAVGGLLIGKRPLLTLGVTGGIVFFVGIAPLGIGSAFPFSLFAIAALAVMYWRLGRRDRPGLSTGGDSQAA